MNDATRRMVYDRMMRGEDRRRGDERMDDRRGYDGHYGHERHRGMEYRGNVEYRGDYRGRDRGYDGDYDRRDRRRDYDDGRRDYEDGRRDYNDGRRDYRGRDYEDGRRRNSMGRFTDRADRRDYGEEEEVYLKKEDMERWADELKNEDGTRGAHFEKRMIKEAMKGGGSDKYTEDELCMVANMLYSDYCAVLHPYISHEPEKEAQFYAKMAKAFLDDKDGPEPSEKLALYYYCIVEGDD